jgi:lipopolysaccharide export system protein LptA
MSLTDSNSTTLKRVATLFYSAITTASLLFAHNANAIDNQRELPIDIASDSASINDESGVAVYSGNVIVSQGRTRLEADTVSVYMKEQALERIEANGQPARFQEQQLNETVPTTGHASKIIFESSKATLTFSGKATLNQASNSFSGEQIVYDINAQAIQAKGDESGQSRVKIQYLPGTPAINSIPSTSRTPSINPAEPSTEALPETTETTETTETSIATPPANTETVNKSAAAHSQQTPANVPETMPPASDLDK